VTRSRAFYSGDATIAFGDEGDAVDLITSKCDQEVIVDPEPWKDRYNSLHIGRSEPILVFDPTYKDLDDSDLIPVPAGETLRFCPPRFLGCLPKDRLIAQFKVEAVPDDRTVQIDDGLFERSLQLADETKNIILSQVKYQKDDPSRNTDIIPGKGNNLVILLHGPPGVGKTLTAETVAKATGRPLLQATIADVGLRAEEAESRLSRIFAVASRWHAILLMDEADAFLEARQETADPERNAFVTVMLRILEYHSGIVMLTTNRLTTIDNAVQSRIHLAVRYEDLGWKDCVKIFETTIKRSGVNYKPSDYDAMMEWMTETAKENQDEPAKALNGREIRNFVTGAIAFMKHQNRDSLKLEHVKEVFRHTKQFKRQLEEQMWNWKQAQQGVSKRSAR